MSLYYTTNAQGLTSNSSAATETDHMRALTGTTRAAAIVQAFISARNATVGGMTLRLRRYSTPSSSGSAITPTAKDPGAQSAVTSFYTAPTPGSTATQVKSVGASQTGAQGFWGAAEANDAETLQANGGANGNIDFFSICNGTSVPLDLTVEHIE
jgi:hypothetical protein